MDFSIGNFRVTYVDYRGYWPDSKAYLQNVSIGLSSLICPSETATTTGTADLLRPTVLLVEQAPAHQIWTVIGPCLQAYKAAGGLLVHVGQKQRTVSPKTELTPNDAKSKEYAGKGEDYLDPWPMAHPMFNHRRQNGPALRLPDETKNHAMSAVHFVQQCLEPSRHKRICSEVLEMEVFVVMHILNQHQLIDLRTLHKRRGCASRTGQLLNKNLCVNCPMDGMKHFSTSFDTVGQSTHSCEQNLTIIPLHFANHDN